MPRPIRLLNSAGAPQSWLTREKAWNCKSVRLGIIVTKPSRTLSHVTRTSADHGSPGGCGPKVPVCRKVRGPDSLKWGVRGAVLRIFTLLCRFGGLRAGLSLGESLSRHSTAGSLGPVPTVQVKECPLVIDLRAFTSLETDSWSSRAVTYRRCSPSSGRTGDSKKALRTSSSASTALLV